MSITVSIVSHGHGAEVSALLGQFAELRHPALRRVIVTVNVPEPDPPGRMAAQRLPFELRWIENAKPAGFGANHNQAFDADARAGASDCFAVVNPDVRLLGDPFSALLEALAQADAGCAYPVQVDASGRTQDHERALPSPAALLRRYLGQRDQAAGRPPDWVNAAFLVVPYPVFQSVGGFDTRYHMYCEDVDFCLRIQLAGKRLIGASASRIEHRASRATRRSGRHLLWHVSSLWKLWNSPAYRDFKRLRDARHCGSCPAA